jgi:uncharacterized protein (DUF4415 family)
VLARESLERMPATPNGKRPYGLINIMLDAPIVEHFKALAGKRGYQTIINDTLRRVIETGHLEADLRRVIREELARR